ncbi:MAG: NAD(P)H-quinone oxidoreductase subunit L [Coleofasciculaceae cyanobacterium]
MAAKTRSLAFLLCPPTKTYTHQTMIVALLYLVLSGTYLLVAPGALYLYLQKRWYVASSFERGFMYFLVFFFFPGLILLSPFLNFRPKRRQVQA